LKNLPAPAISCICIGNILFKIIKYYYKPHGKQLERE
jgi:hypothetical protein